MCRQQQLSQSQVSVSSLQSPSLVRVVTREHIFIHRRQSVEYYLSVSLNSLSLVSTLELVACFIKSLRIDGSVC